MYNFLILPGTGLMDMVALSGIYLVLRCLLRGGTRIYSMDDNCRAIFAGAKAGRNVHCCPYQLVCQFSCGNWISNYAGTVQGPHVYYFYERVALAPRSSVARSDKG